MLISLSHADSLWIWWPNGLVNHGNMTTRREGLLRDCWVVLPFFYYCHPLIQIAQLPMCKDECFQCHFDQQLDLFLDYCFERKDWHGSMLGMFQELEPSALHEEIDNVGGFLGNCRLRRNARNRIPEKYRLPGKNIDGYQSQRKYPLLINGRQGWTEKTGRDLPHG